MALGREARRPERRPAPALARDWTSQRIHPAGGSSLVVVLLIMPAIANEFILFQIFAWSFILGMIALSLMFLAGYGGMVSLAQMTIAGFAGYMVAIFGVNGVAGVSIGWPWWLAAADGAGPGDGLRRDHRRARGAHRGHLHDHDHARDRVGVLLLHQPELCDLQRPYRHQQRPDAGFPRRRLARADPLLLSRRSASPRSATPRSAISRARRSGSRCRACATTRAGWPRSASTSTPIASPPMCSRR